MPTNQCSPHLESKTWLLSIFNLSSLPSPSVYFRYHSSRHMSFDLYCIPSEEPVLAASLCVARWWLFTLALPQRDSSALQREVVAVWGALSWSRLLVIDSKQTARREYWCISASSAFKRPCDPFERFLWWSPGVKSSAASQLTALHLHSSVGSLSYTQSYIFFLLLCFDLQWQLSIAKETISVSSHPHKGEGAHV